MPRGANFDDLCKGKVKDYSFNVVNLRNLTTQERINALIAKINETIDALELQSGRKIEQLSIGKTYAQARSKKTFSPTDVNTWRVGGISNRWKNGPDAYRALGYDGLVVVGAVSRGMLKAERDKKVWNQQLYVLALENALITHFAYEECDPRLANTSLQTGHLQKSLSAGYVVYIAFKYEEGKGFTLAWNTNTSTLTVDAFNTLGSMESVCPKKKNGNT